MSAKIIDSRRYKTISKTQLNKKKKKVEADLKEQKKNYKKSNKTSTNNSNSSFISSLRLKKHRERKLEREMLLYARPQRTVLKEPKQKIYIPKSFVIFCCVVVLILIVYISAKITKIEDKETVNVFGNEEKVESTINLEPNYDLKIGLTSFENNDVYTSNNLILNDLYKQTALTLIKVENNYSIKYQVARTIDKISDLEYHIVLNDSYKIDFEDIKYSIDKILNAGESNMYYDRLVNISSIEQLENKKKFKIILKEKNPYFVYFLEFPILDKDNKVFSDFIYNAGVFEKTQRNENTNLNSIKVTNYTNINGLVDSFINNEIDMFFATSNNDMQLIGKKDYNVKKYKDGETLFIFGNKDSSIFSKKEVRKALMYSLNRDELVKDSDNNFIEVIDLPYLYSSIKYKYDIVGSKNIMESNGWNKNGYGIYDKYEENDYLSATLKLLVNEQDANKVNVANNIKNMAQNAGINIEIETLSNENIKQRVSAGDYDIVLATVYLNETPDINFLRDYLDINSTTQQAFLQVENSSVLDLEKNIQNLEYTLSEEVACIGIFARNINMVYQKYIYGFNELNYMNIFTNLYKIGKIIE